VPSPLMRDNVTATECHRLLMQTNPLVLNRKGHILSTSYDISIHQ